MTIVRLPAVPARLFKSGEEGRRAGRGGANERRTKKRCEMLGCGRKRREGDVSGLLVDGRKRGSGKGAGKAIGRVIGLAGRHAIVRRGSKSRTDDDSGPAIGSEALGHRMQNGHKQQQKQRMKRGAGFAAQAAQQCGTADHDRLLAPFTPERH